MKIAIDMDDCICSTLDWDFACAWKFNKQRHPKDNKFYYQIYHASPEIFGFTKEETEEFYLENRHFLIDKKLIYPKPFVKEVIDQLLKDGHEIYIVTSREDKYWHGDSYGNTQKWLKKYKINYTQIFANCIEKGVKCAELKVDLLIDDNPKYVSQVNAQGIRTIVLSAPYNLKYKNVLNAHASCWPEVYQIVTELDASLKEYKLLKQEREKVSNHKIIFVPLKEKTLLNAVKLQDRIDKRHCLYLIYKQSLGSDLGYYFVYDGDELIGITGFYTLEEYPDDVWLGNGGVLPHLHRKGYGKRIIKKLIEKAREKGFKTFRIVSNFVENPSAQSLYREVSDVCEYYNENDKKPCRYIYSKALDGRPVVKWNGKNAKIAQIQALEREGRKALKKISEY